MRSKPTEDSPSTVSRAHQRVRSDKAQDRILPLLPQDRMHKGWKWPRGLACTATRETGQPEKMGSPTAIQSQLIPPHLRAKKAAAGKVDEVSRQDMPVEGMLL